MSVIPMPPAAGPDPGQPGHFAHHDWLEQAVLALDEGGGTGIPDPVHVAGSGGSVTASAWAALPTPLKVNLDTPAPVWCLLNYSMWWGMTNQLAGGDARASVDIYGATVIPVSSMVGAVAGENWSWGDVLYASSAGTAASWQKSATRVVRVNAGVTTFEMKAYRTNTPTVSANYISIRVIPLRWA